MSKSHFQHDMLKKVFQSSIYDDVSKELVTRVWGSDEKAFQRGLKQAARGFPSNNRRKLHKQPMYRWRWLT